MLDFFKLHVSDYGEALLGMSDENIGKVFRGLIEYSLEKEQTEISDASVSAIYTVMRLHIDRDEEYRRIKAESGKIGGQAKSSKVKQNVAKRSKGVAKCSNANDVLPFATEMDKQTLPPYPNPYPNPNNNNYIVSEIVDYLNDKTKSHYQARGKTFELINARLNDGYTVDDFKKVIDKKYKEWKGTPYEKFLRPSTLFAPGHFEEYLNQPDREIKGNTFTDGVMTRDIDFDALEKELIRN